MRHDFRDGIDRKVNAGIEWSRPQLTPLPITPEQHADIMGAANIKAALRSYYRSYKNGDGASWRLVTSLVRDSD